MFAEYSMKALTELINDSGEEKEEGDTFDINSFIMNQMNHEAA